ncbi:MAG: hypothetical protein HYX73_01555 [Acidobacteria bacterium]|nr:hypothetical protein [Acidobacteriota bacterium]
MNATVGKQYPQMSKYRSKEAWGRQHPLGAELIFAVVILLAATRPMAAQDPGQRVQAAAHARVNFAELARREAARPPAQIERRAVPFMPLPFIGTEAPVEIQPIPEAAPPKADAVPPGAQLTLPAAQAPSPSPVASFEALGDDNTVIPPDTMGAVGPNHLMVMLNSQVRVQNRSGTALSTMSLDTFWEDTGASLPFDPRVMYDACSDRWIAAAVSDRATASSSVLVGVSQTGDPGGVWNLYRFDDDATDTNWADYPMLGFNKNWVVVTVNRFPNAGGAFVNSFIYIFSKADLYTGDASPIADIFSDTFTGGGPSPAATYDSNCASQIATQYLARVWTTNFAGEGGNSGSLKISTITGSVDFPSYNSNGPEITTLNPWAFLPNVTGADFAPQSGTGDKIQNGDSRLLNLVYRNGSLWAAHNAFLPASSPTRTAAQWWQFSTTGTLQQFGRVESTSGPLFFAYPSIAVNANNDAMLGFTRFSATTLPSAYYAARNASDAPGTMRTPVILKAGEASYYKVFGGTRNRWGDYSATVVDPVNDLDFWTIQEYADSPQFSPPDYGRWGTWWGMLNPPPPLGSVSWEKRKATDNTLQSGATFTLGGASGPFACIGIATNPISVVDNGVNDADLDAGQIQVNEVCLGTYTITETVAPAGWALDLDATRAITVSSGDLNAVVGTQGVNDAGTTNESDFHNRLGSISWEKRQATDNAPQGGATFEVSPNPLTGSGTLVIVDNDVNDANAVAGQIQINNALLGTYTITETVAPAGWALDLDATRAITVSSGELNPVVGTQGSNDAGTTNESDFHNLPLRRRGQLVSD